MNKHERITVFFSSTEYNWKEEEMMINLNWGSGDSCIEWLAAAAAKRCAKLARVWGMCIWEGDRVFIEVGEN